MRARYYFPKLRRFVNADIIAGDISNATTLNRYSYVCGNPVSYIDPVGLSKDRGQNNVSNTESLSLFDDEIAVSILASTNSNIPWNELNFPGEIHNEVVRYLANKYNLEKEYSKINPQNRYDLYSPQTNQYWEVKPITYLYNREKQAAMSQQMEKYDKDGIIRGVPLGDNQTQYLDFKIHIYSAEPGKVYYVFGKSKKQPAEANASVPAKEVEEKETEKTQIDWGEAIEVGGKAAAVVGGILILGLGIYRLIIMGDTSTIQQGYQHIFGY